MSDTSDIAVLIAVIAVVIMLLYIVGVGIYRDQKSASKNLAKKRDKAAKELAEQRRKLKPVSIVLVDRDSDAAFDPKDLESFVLSAEKSTRRARNAHKKAMTDMKRAALEELCQRSFPPDQYYATRIGHMYTAMQSYFLREHTEVRRISSCWNEAGEVAPSSVLQGSRNSPVTPRADRMVAFEFEGKSD